MISNSYMGKGLAITGFVLSILSLLLVWYIRVILFTFNNFLELTLIYLTIVIGIAGLIINLIVLIKKKDGRVLSWIGIALLIISFLIPQIFKQIR